VANMSHVDLNLADSDEFGRIYLRLKDVARSYLANERDGHTLQPTALVHEAYIRLLGSHPPGHQNRLEHCEIVALAMRRILVDYARKRAALKRGGDVQRVALHGDSTVDSAADAMDVVALNDAIDRLTVLNPRHARVVQFRYFAGMSIEETAEALGVSDWTVKNDWRAARAWLKVQLRDEASS
jgi:RNA polymerase sigma-70 factor (ECF subfamily)